MSNRLYLPSRKPGIGARINARHPLANGLVGAWLFNEGSGGTRNLARAGDNLALDGAAAWAVTPEGLAGRTTGWNGFTNSAPSLAMRPAYLKTVLWQGVMLGPVVDPTDAPPLFAHYANTTSSAPYNSGSIHRYIDDFIVLFAWNNGTFNSMQFSFLPGPNIPVQIALVLDGTQAVGYLNGQIVGNNTTNIPTAGTPIQYDASNYQSFGVHPAASVDVNAAASMILEWDRALSQVELGAIRDQPYRLFQAWPAIIIGTPSAAGISGAAIGSSAARATDAGSRTGSSAIAARLGARATATGVKSISAAVAARAGADAVSAGQERAQGTLAARAAARATAAGAQGAARPGLSGSVGARATAIGVKSISAAIAARVGDRAVTAGQDRAQGALVARAGVEATAAGVQVGARPPTTAHAGARATATGRMQASAAIAARVGDRATSAGTEAASGAIVARSAARASATGVQVAAPHTLVGSTGARAIAVGRKGGLSSIASSTGARVAMVAQKRALAASTSRAGVGAVVVGVHRGASTIFARAGQRGRAGGGQGELPVEVGRCAVDVPARELVGAATGRELVGAVAGRGTTLRVSEVCCPDG